jgi:hypothetical protein
MKKFSLIILIALASGFSVFASCDSLAITHITVINTTCYDTANGVIIVTSTGGVGPVKYALPLHVFQLSDTFSHLSAGYYTIYVKDSLGCTLAIDTELHSKVIIIDTSVQNVTTVGGTNGAIWIDSITGGTPPYG